MILNSMFNNGENSKVSLQWELLDTPPAIAWRNMLEYSLENPKENPLTITESVFCATRDEANAKWTDIRNGLTRINHTYAKLPFGKLSNSHATHLLEDLLEFMNKGVMGSIEKAVELKRLIDVLKDVLFYLDHVKASEFNDGNEGSSFGHLIHTPDPHVGIEFKPEWHQYLTMNIEPGTLYAELIYDDLAWYQILEFGDITNAYKPIKEKRFGSPRFLGSGHMIPFGKDIGGLEVDLLEYFHKHFDAIKHLDSSFDAMYAVRSSGRIPVATLATKVGEVGYPSYADLQQIDSMFKMELYESY